MAEGGEGIASLDDIMTIRPQSSFQVSVEEGALTTPASRRREKKDQRAALAAVLDGYPIERHEALADRVRVVEVDVTANKRRCLPGSMAHQCCRLCSTEISMMKMRLL